MTARGIAYVELNTSTDDTAREFLLSEGLKSVPVIAHGGTLYKTPDSIMTFIKGWKP